MCCKIEFIIFVELIYCNFWCMYVKVDFDEGGVFCRLYSLYYCFSVFCGNGILFYL